MNNIELWALVQSNKSQKEILLLLKQTEALHQSEIARKIKKSQPTVHYHLEILIKYNLLQMREVGKFRIYFLTELGKEFANRLTESLRWDS
ncbi:MAG: winged helix-turn-helix transcriptional regulator [Candidatus Hodarchaeota archaeon]